MRKIISGLFISLDGVVESPDQWSFDYFDDGLMDAISAKMAEQDAVIMGRVSYEEWSSYWPTSTDEPFASFINNIRKYVVSSTLETVEWNNSTLLQGDWVEEIKQLKQQSGKSIGVQASPTLVEALLDHDLLDELMLAVHPVAARSGRRLFTEGRGKLPLKLVETKTTDKSVVIMTFQPDRKADD